VKGLRGDVMRDRNFITWIFGLLAMAILLDRYPNYAATAPIVLSVAALLAMVVTSLLTMVERLKSQNDNEHGHLWAIAHLRRPVGRR
jgi:uncharacterized membrane protein YhhN